MADLNTDERTVVERSNSSFNVANVIIAIASCCSCWACLNISARRPSRRVTQRLCWRGSRAKAIAASRTMAVASAYGAVPAAKAALARSRNCRAGNVGFGLSQRAGWHQIGKRGSTVCRISTTASRDFRGPRRPRRRVGAMTSSFATPCQSDAAGILSMYNYAVRETTAIFDPTPSDLAGREAWLAKRQADGFPCWSPRWMVRSSVSPRSANFAHGTALASPSTFDLCRSRAAPRGYRPRPARDAIDRARVAGKHASGGDRRGQCRLDRAPPFAGFYRGGPDAPSGDEVRPRLDLVFLQHLLDDRLQP